MSAGKLAALGGQDGELFIAIEDEPERIHAPNWRGAGGLPLPSVGMIFGWMLRVGIETMHVHRSALPLLGLPDESPVPRKGERRPAHPFVDGVRVNGRPLNTKSLIPSIVAGKQEVLIGAYQDGAGDPFEDAEDERELLLAHEAFRAALGGWSYRNSAAVTGWNLMHAPWEYGPRRARLEKTQFKQNARPDLGQDASQFEIPFGSWARSEDAPPFGDLSAKRQPYVSAWDVNGQRLAACARLSLGVGGLEHRTGRAAQPFDKRLPGYHYVKTIENPFGRYLPAIFEPGWHTTPRVAMAAYLGLKFKITESWVWTEHEPYLNPWYERIRDARAWLLQPDRAGGASDLALDALKRCYLEPLGRLRSARAGERGDVYYRPDWYDAVIGQELARQYLRMFELAKAGRPILAVYFDTLILETPQPELPPPELPVTGQLGKYKPLGTLPIGPARKALYTESGPNVAKLIDAIKRARVADGTRLDGTPGRGKGRNRSALAPWPSSGADHMCRPVHGGYPDV